MLVSILIPACNVERWISDTIRSALAQSWKETEIIVVDDGSHDATFALAQSFESNKVKVVRQENAGAAAARNKAYSLSQGDYIQWLDADDLLGINKIELQVRHAQELADKRKLLSCGWATFLHRPQAARFQPTSLWRDLSPADWLTHKLGENLHMQTATWLTSRELAEAIGPWNREMWIDDDGEYFTRALLASSGVAFIPEAKVYYRMTNRQRLSVMGTSARKQDAMLASMRFHIAALRSLADSPQVHQACVQYLQNWLFEFYPERPDIVQTMQELAAEMDGDLAPPHLSWKYRWIKKLFGWKRAKQARLTLPSWKGNLLSSIDAVLHRAQKATDESKGVF